MNILVVYDSEYGNTADLARVIGSNLDPLGSVTVASVRDSPEIDLSGVDLLVIGGPTQGHGMSKPMRTWLDGVPAVVFDDLPVAAFDTRLGWPQFLSGSAARKIADFVQHRGARLVAPPGSFIVAGSEGPLREGEIDRAVDWTHNLTAGAVEATA